MRFLALLILLLTGVASAPAATTALIVIGLTADEKDAALWRVEAEEARTALLARGVPTNNITLLTGDNNQPVTRDSLLAAMAKTQTATGAAGECWILLLGHSAPSRDGSPAFQLRGPRLSAGDLHDALAAFTGPTYVLLGTELSSDYLPLLKTLPQCNAVAASNGPMTPRFTGFWVDALKANPKATFTQLADGAAKQVVSYYKDNSLAQGETASLLSGQEIQEPPFKNGAAGPAASATAPANRANSATTARPAPTVKPAPATSLNVNRGSGRSAGINGTLLELREPPVRVAVS